MVPVDPSPFFLIRKEIHGILKFSVPEWLSLIKFQIVVAFEL